MTKPNPSTELLATPQVFQVRGHSVMLDADVADLFQIETRSLNQQANCNASKFDGFAFRLTEEKASNLRSQNVMSNDKHGGRDTFLMPLPSMASSWPRRS